MKPKLIAALIILVVVVIFAIQNSEAVTVRLFFWYVEMPRVLWIVATTALGFAAGYLAARSAARGAAAR